MLQSIYICIKCVFYRVHYTIENYLYRMFGSSGSKRTFYIESRNLKLEQAKNKFEIQNSDLLIHVKNT